MPAENKEKTIVDSMREYKRNAEQKGKTEKHI